MIDHPTPNDIPAVRGSIAGQGEKKMQAAVKENKEEVERKEDIKEAKGKRFVNRRRALNGRRRTK